MSSGRRHSPIEQNETKSKAQFYKMMGTGNTGELKAQKFKVDTSYDIANGGGIAVDRKTVYVDHELYEDIQSGEITVKGMTPDQIVGAIVEHEIDEKCVADGDNPVDNYEGAHPFGNAGEDIAVEAVGAKPSLYNAALEPGLERAYAKTPKKVPKDLWCAPNRDDPNPRDEELIKRWRALGVTDAVKESKQSAHYGIGLHECCDCAFFQGPADKFGNAPCQKIGGLIRIDRQCDWWRDKKGSVRDDVEAAYQEHADE